MRSTNPDEIISELSGDPVLSNHADLLSLVAKLRLLIRLNKLSDDTWTRLFRMGIGAAIEQRDWLIVAELGHTALSRHEAAGRMDAFIAEMDWAIAVASTSADAMLYLTSLRAAAQATMGDFVAAKENIAVAATFRTGSSDGRAVSEFQTNRLVVGLKALTDTPSDEDVTGFVEGEEDDSFSGLVVSWYIRYLVACGRDDEARRWTPWLGERSVEQSRPWRAAEAQVFAHALAGDLERPENVNPRFYTAAWMLAVSRLRSALLSDNRGQVIRRLSGVGEIVQRVVPATRDGSEAYSALGAAYLTGATDEIAPPSHLSLQNLGSALAGLEAVALAGSDAQVERWLEWHDATWPEHIVSSLEWRASAPRLRGLLLLRLGRLDEALECLDAAIERPVSSIEGDIAELQRFELTDPEHPRRPVIWERLAVAGVAPHLQAYAVLSALRRADSASTPDREGATEVERRR